MNRNRPERASTNSIRKRLARPFKTFATLSGIAGIAVILLQCLWWFQNGFWSGETLLDFWLALGNSYSMRSLNGAERIGLWLLDLPLGPVLLGIAAVVFWLGKRIDA
jgi:hypothetical protein